MELKIAELKNLADRLDTVYDIKSNFAEIVLSLKASVTDALATSCLCLDQVKKNF